MGGTRRNSPSSPRGRALYSPCLSHASTAPGNPDKDYRRSPRTPKRGEYRHLSAPRCRRPTRRCLASAKRGRAGGATMTAPVEFASVLGPIIMRHLDLKRALGRRADSLQYALTLFDRFLASRNAKDLNQETFAAWCLSIAHLAENTRRQRMRVVNHLCLFPAVKHDPPPVWSAKPRTGEDRQGAKESSWSVPGKRWWRCLEATLERVCRKAAQKSTSVPWRPSFSGGNRPALF